MSISKHVFFNSSVLLSRLTRSHFEVLSVVSANVLLSSRDPAECWRMLFIYVFFRISGKYWKIVLHIIYVALFYSDVCSVSKYSSTLYRVVHLEGVNIVFDFIHCELCLSHEIQIESKILIFISFSYYMIVTIGTFDVESLYMREFFRTTFALSLCKSLIWMLSFGLPSCVETIVFILGVVLSIIWSHKINWMRGWHINCL